MTADDEIPVTTETLLLALVHQTTRIADSLNTPPSTKSRAEVLDAWERVGMRVFEDEAVEFAKQLGIEVT
jgi:hypothetical protein